MAWRQTTVMLEEWMVEQIDEMRDAGVSRAVIVRALLSGALKKPKPKAETKREVLEFPPDLLRSIPDIEQRWKARMAALPKAKKVTVSAQRKQLDYLLGIVREHGRDTAIDLLDTTTRNGWQGLDISYLRGGTRPFVGATARAHNPGGDAHLDAGTVRVGR